MTCLVGQGYQPLNSTAPPTISPPPLLGLTVDWPGLLGACCTSPFPTQGLMAGQPGWLGLNSCSNTILLRMLTYLSPSRPPSSLLTLHRSRCRSARPPATITSCNSYCYYISRNPCAIRALCGERAESLCNHQPFFRSSGNRYICSPASCIHSHHCLRPQALPSPPPPPTMRPRCLCCYGRHHPLCRIQDHRHLCLWLQL
jgi:hypothetical protein